MSENIKNTEAEAIAKIAATPTVAEIEGVPILFIPENFQREFLPNLLPKPSRKTGVVILNEVESFIEFSKRHGSLTNTNIYLDVDYAEQRVNATTYFNDHGDGENGDAGWRDFKAVFEPKFTEEWMRWNNRNKKVFMQSDFAHFLEENIGDISGGVDSLPTGSDVLTFVSALEETRQVKYGSAINLQNGMVQVEFIEEGDKGTRGKLEMFREFAIGIRPFMGGSAYQVRAFLRYRIDRNTGQISFWFELQRPDRILEDATKEIIESIKTKTGLHVFFGRLAEK